MTGTDYVNIGGEKKFESLPTNEIIPSLADATKRLTKHVFLFTVFGSIRLILEFLCRHGGTKQ